ncbi:MFS transporter [Plantactinospora sp. KBS50]|uniref:MFS transporter n=1 Tax=Plantactinospora sp. KBS50 TaxID=2024580 RepID=UPI0012FD0662|nr:MFS transporter [Plantactinospora sp. KBS50]
MTAAPTALRRNRDFNLLWGSLTLSQLGSNISGLAFPLLVLALTGSPVQAGAVGTVAAVARVATRLPAGVLLDRVNRRTAMLVCDGVRLVAFGGLGVLVLTDHATLLLIGLTAVIESVGSAIFEIAERSALPMVVPLEQIPDAIARNSVRGAATALVGPPIGGTLFGIARALPFLADALSYLLSFIGIYLIRRPMQKDAAERERVPILRGLRDGLRFVFTHRFLRAYLFIAVSFNLAIQGTTFCLYLALRLHGVPPREIGFAEAILGLGGLAGGFLAGFLRRRLSLLALVRGICWGGAALLGVDALLAGRLVSAIPIAVVFLLLPAINSVLIGHQAAITPNEMQGRVASVLGTFAGGLATLGPLIAGAFVHGVGAPAAMIFSAAVMGVGALVATFGRGIREMRPVDRPVATAGAGSS